MNYLQEIIAFERWLEANHLPCLSQLLWYRLLALCNRAGWPEWIAVDNQRLMSMIQTERQASMVLYRDALIASGLMEYHKGAKGKPGRYKLFSFNFVHESCENSAENPERILRESCAIPVTISSYPTDTQKLKENRADAPRFTPPSYDEVRAYCTERRYAVDAETFVDFYAAKGWKVGTTSMKDWKAAVRTWAKRNAQRTQPALHATPDKPMLWAEDEV